MVQHLCGEIAEQTVIILLLLRILHQEGLVDTLEEQFIIWLVKQCLQVCLENLVVVIYHFESLSFLISPHLLLRLPRVLPRRSHPGSLLTEARLAASKAERRLRS